MLPPRPELIPYDVRLNRDASGGALLIGERGVMLHGMWGEDPQLYPQSLMEEAARVPQRYPRLKPTEQENWHEQDWVDAIRENRPANFLLQIIRNKWHRRTQKSMQMRTIRKKGRK